MPKRCTTCGGVYTPRTADGSDYFHACAPTTSGDGLTTTERANKRDENLRRGEAGRDRRIKAAGGGVTDVP